jgi:hypothetical protein
MNLLSTKWMPNPPTLQRAIADGYVGVSDGPQGRVYVVSRQCPNPAQIKHAIALRNMLEIAWAGAVGCVAAAGIALLAHWSDKI